MKHKPRIHYAKKDEDGRLYIESDDGSKIYLDELIGDKKPIWSKHVKIPAPSNSKKIFNRTRDDSGSEDQFENYN